MAKIGRPGMSEHERRRVWDLWKQGNSFSSHAVSAWLRGRSSLSSDPVVASTTRHRVLARQRNPANYLTRDIANPTTTHGMPQTPRRLHPI